MLFRSGLMKIVKQEMTRRVAYVLENDDIQKAYEAMKSLNVRHVPVTRNDKVVGILSDRDLLFHGKPGKDGAVTLPHKKVDDVMTKEVVVCSMSDSIGKIADILIERKISAVPVVDSSHKLVGIITSTDLLKLLRDKAWEIHIPMPFVFERHALLPELAF